MRITIGSPGGGATVGTAPTVTMPGAGAGF
jgi:hypothetical protein